LASKVRLLGSLGPTLVRSAKQGSLQLSNLWSVESTPTFNLTSIAHVGVTILVMLDRSEACDIYGCVGWSRLLRNAARWDRL